MSHLLHLLLSLLLGPMFMFAAGAGGLGDMGGGGGSGDSNAGAGSGEGTAGSSEGDAGAGAGSDASVAAGSEAEDGLHGDGAADGSSDPDAPVDLGDGRQVPAKWKTLFEAAKAQGLDKEVKQLFFGQQKLLAKYPGGINEAVQLAQTVEEFGGVEGIGELKSNLEVYDLTFETFQKDPSKWVESNFSENPEASLKAFAHSLDFVSEHHAETYNHLMAKVIINDLNNSVPIHDIYNLLAGMKDSPQAKQLADKLAAYYNQRNDLSRKVPEKKVDAERQKLEADREKLGTEQEQLRNHTVNSQTIPLLGRQMTTQIDKLAKEAGFDLKKFTTEQPEAAQSLRSKILNQVMEKAASDKTFVKNYKSVIKQGDTARAVSMMNKKHGDILSDIVRNVAKGFGIAKKAGAKPVTPGTRTAAASAGSGSVLRVSAKPDPKEIDWTKTGNRIYDSEAVLKNGKVVTWA